jgi:hypothetical protein
MPGGARDDQAIAGRSSCLPLVYRDRPRTARTRAESVHTDIDRIPAQKDSLLDRAIAIRMVRRRRASPASTRRGAPAADRRRPLHARARPHRVRRLVPHEHRPRHRPHPELDAGEPAVRGRTRSRRSVSLAPVRRICPRLPTDTPHSQNSGPLLVECRPDASSPTRRRRGGRAPHPRGSAAWRLLRNVARGRGDRPRGSPLRRPVVGTVVQHVTRCANRRDLRLR